jgi:ABC-type branched-subunit amino acid transport system substrate-binding protein
MSKQGIHLNFVCAVGASLAALALGCGAASAQSESIRIGVLAPLTGPLATPGMDMDDGLKLLWEQF